MTSGVTPSAGRRRGWYLIVLTAAVAMAVTVVPGDATRAAIDAPGVTGTVRLDGVGISGAVVDVIVAGNVVASGATSSTGSYELGLAASGTVDLRVAPPAGSGASTQTITGVVVPDAPDFATVDVSIRRVLASLTVVVEGGDGGPAAGVDVRLLDAVTNATASFDTTDGAGRVVFRVPGDRQYRLRLDAATGPANLPRDLTLRIVEPVQPTVAGTSVTIAVPTAALTVEVDRTGASGATGVPGTPVAASGNVTGLAVGGGFTADGRFASSAAADATGSASLTVLPGNQTVRAVSRNPLLLTEVVDVVVDAPATTATLVLADAPVTPATVALADALGAPVPGATVTGATSALTDATGSATVDVRTDVIGVLDVSVDGDGVLDLPDHLLFSRSTALVGSDSLQPTLADLVVEVLDDTTSAPIDGALIAITSPTLPAAGGWTVRSSANPTATNASGLATFRLVPGAGYQVTVTLPGTDRVASQTATLAGTGSTSTVRLPAPPAPPAPTGFFAITGRVVTPAGEPVRGLTVRSTVSGVDGVTDADGRFRAPVAGITTHGLWFRGTGLLAVNGFDDASVPDEINLYTVPFVSVGTDDVDVGEVVLPLDQLDVKVSDESGGGIGLLSATTGLSGGSTTVTIGGTPVSGSGRSGYVSNGARLDDLGEATLQLLRGTYQISVAESGLVNFPDLDLPAEQTVSVTAGTDTLLLVLQRRYGAPFTTLDGSPREASTPLTLRLPDAVVAPSVELPLDLLGGVAFSTVVVADRWWCGEGSARTVVLDPLDCAEDLAEIVLTDLDPDGRTVFPPSATYPLTLPVKYWSSVIVDLPIVGPTFIREGTRLGEIVLLAPIDEPPVIELGPVPDPAPEGSLVQLTATGTDAEGEAVVSWDLDDDGIPDADGASVWVEVPDGPSFTPVRAFATDTNGRSVNTSLEIVAENVPPTGQLDVRGPTGGFVTLEVTGLDDAAPADVPGLAVSFDTDGDGTFESAGNPVQIDVSSFGPATYDVAARITDDDGGVTDLPGSFVVAAPSTTTTVASTVSTTTVASPTSTTSSTTTATAATTSTTVAPTDTTGSSTTVPPPATTPPTTAAGPELSPVLPQTGGSGRAALPVGLLLVVGGIALITITRRRSTIT